MHSIIRHWLIGTIQYCKYVDGKLKNAHLQHCLYCINGDMLMEEKELLWEEFIKSDDRRLFHLSRMQNRQELFAFIVETSSCQQ